MPKRSAVLECLESRLMLTVSAEEQLFVYLLNRARANPAAYQTEANPPIPTSVVNLSTIAARPPLAVNDQLFASAEIKADDISLDQYSFVDTHHYSPTLAEWPNETVRNAGYALPAGWANDANYVESLGAGPATANSLLREFITEENNPAGDDGHRVHLMGIDGHALNNEIGVGHTFVMQSGYRDYWAIHATYRDSSFKFLTGVVFNDLNHNGRYDLYEGLSGVSISAGAFNTTTNAAGGWSIQVPDGPYTVTATGGAFNGPATIENVAVNGVNVEVDFASGLPGGWVGFQRVGAQPPSITVGSETAAEGNSGTQAMTFTVSLAEASPETWTVTYSTANGTATAGSDYAARTGSLTFLPGETSKSIVIDIAGDTGMEENETFTLNVVGPANTMPVTGTIVNDDVPQPIYALSISDAAVAEGASGAVLLTFTVTVSQPSDQAITVGYSTADGSATAGVDYAAQTDVLQFLPGQTSKTVTVMVLGDLTPEADKTVLVTLSGPAGATIARAQGIGTILNDDAVLVPSIMMKVGATKRLPLANGQRKAVSFGSVAVGARPPVQKFWVYNTGNAALAIGRIRLPKGFALASTQPKVVAPGRVATFLVKLATTVAKKYSGQITFGTTDPNSPTYRIPVAGSVGMRTRATAASFRTAASPIEQRRADYAGIFSSSVIRDSAAAGVLEVGSSLGS